MQVIPPIEITDSMLTSSTVPEAVAPTYSAGTTYAQGDLAGAAPVTGQAQIVWRSLQNANTGNAQVEGVWWTKAGEVYPAYSSGTTYAANDFAQDNTNHLIYKSLVGSNTGNALTDATKWQLIGPTNRWAMFDYARNSAATVPNSLTVVITPGQRINSIALSGLRANSYSISVSSTTGGGVVYTDSGSLNTRQTLTWYDYFFGTFDTQESYVTFEVPPYTDSVITITLSVTSGNVSCGSCVVGSFVYLGETQYNAVSDVLNFSTITRAEDGSATLTARRNIPTTQQTVWADKSRVNKIRQLREDLNATPAIWYGIADDGDGYFESLSILGIYKEFVINVALPEKAILSIKLEEI